MVEDLGIPLFKGEYINYGVYGDGLLKKKMCLECWKFCLACAAISIQN